MKKKSFICLIALLASAHAHLEPPAPDYQPHPDVIARFGAIINGSANFALSLYRTHASTQPSTANIVFSPFSIHSALNLIGAGALGSMMDQIWEVLGTSDPSSYQDYVERVTAQEEEKSYSLGFADRIFADNTVMIKRNFSKFLNRHGVEKVKRVDFLDRPQESRERINGWVRRHTMGMVKELLREEQVTSLTRLYPVNALALKAKWDIGFVSTGRGMFQLPDGAEVETDLMRSHSQRCKFFRSSEALSLMLPLKGGKLQFVAVSPNDVGNFSSFEHEGAGGETLLVRTFRQLDATRTSTCAVTMPKFAISHRLDELKSHLRDMGVRDAFEPGLADLRALTNEDIYVSDAVHAAEFELDKDGVRASASTAFGAVSRSGPRQVVMKRPFVFAIRHAQYDAVLFLGRLANPNN